jgi:hypothetical protein
LIYELAGAVGVDPGPYTLRELDLMARGRGRMLWGIASHVLALVANVHRKPGSSPIEAASLNPFAELDRTEVKQRPRVGVSALKAFLRK